MAYLHMHVMALMVATLIERQLRRTMKRRSIPSLPLYPEDRPCPYPTLFDIVRAFRGVERYEVLDGQDSCVELPAKLFTNEVVTVEGWVKWDRMQGRGAMFDFVNVILKCGSAPEAEKLRQRISCWASREPGRSLRTFS